MQPTINYSTANGLEILDGPRIGAYRATYDDLIFLICANIAANDLPEQQIFCVVDDEQLEDFISEFGTVINLNEYAA